MYVGLFPYMWVSFHVYSRIFCHGSTSSAHCPCVYIYTHTQKQAVYETSTATNMYTHAATNSYTHTVTNSYTQIHMHVYFEVSHRKKGCVFK